MECFSLSLLSPTFILNPNLPHLSNSQSTRSLTIKVRLEKERTTGLVFTMATVLFLLRRNSTGCGELLPLWPHVDHPSWQSHLGIVPIHAYL